MNTPEIIVCSLCLMIISYILGWMSGYDLGYGRAKHQAEAILKMVRGLSTIQISRHE